MSSVGFHARFLAIACVGSVLGGVGACASLLGYDDGSPLPEGGPEGASDGMLLDRTVEAGDSRPLEAGDSSDGSCLIDLSSVCSGRCGLVHACGVPVNCGSNTCTMDQTCDLDAGKCTCAPAAGFCSNRCGTAMDNCGNEADCGTCDGGVMCTNNACGCDAEAPPQACGSHNCGSVMNNCNQTVYCGPGGTFDCQNPSDPCINGTCCSPDPAASCAAANACNTSVTDTKCGTPDQCPPACPDGGLCDASGCCYDNGANWCQLAGITCGRTQNNCGSTVACPCPMGQHCNANQCVGGCISAGGGCSSQTDCCQGQGLSCFNNGAGGGVCQTGSCPITCATTKDCCYPQTCGLGLLGLVCL